MKIYYHLSNYILLIQNLYDNFYFKILRRKFYVPSPVNLYSFDTKSRFFFFYRKILFEFTILYQEIL